MEKIGLSLPAKFRFYNFDMHLDFIIFTILVLGYNNMIMQITAHMISWDPFNTGLPLDPEEVVKSKHI